MKNRIAFILCFFVVSSLFAQNNNNDEIIVKQNGLFSTEQIIASTDKNGSCLYLMILDKLSNYVYAIKADYSNDTEKELIKSKMIELVVTFENHISENIEPKILLYAHKYKTLYREVNQKAYEVKLYIWN